MAKTLTNLAVYMTMNNSGLKKGATEAKSIVSGMGSGLAKMAALGGVTLSAAGAVMALKKVYAALGDIADGADRLGITTDAYQELRYAASKTGATMEQVEMATTKAGQAMEKAAEGDKKMVAALASLGMSWQDLAGMSPDKQLEKIGSALAKVEDATKRNNLAIEIFGKSGAKLNPLFNELSGLRDEAKALGVVIGEDTIRKAEAAGDAFERMGDKILAVVANSGLVQWLDEVVQGLDAVINSAGSMNAPNQKIGVYTRETAVDPAIAQAEKSGKYDKLQMNLMRNYSDSYKRGISLPFGSTIGAQGYGLIDQALSDMGFSKLQQRERKFSPNNQWDLWTNFGNWFGGMGFSYNEAEALPATKEQIAAKDSTRISNFAKQFTTQAKDFETATAELKKFVAGKMNRDLTDTETKFLDPKIAELKAKYDAIAAAAKAKEQEITDKINSEIEKQNQDNYLAQMKLNGATEGQIALQQRLFRLNKEITELTPEQVKNLRLAAKEQDRIAEATKQQQQAAEKQRQEDENRTERLRQEWAVYDFMRDRGASLRQMALKAGGFEQQSLIEQRLQEAMDKKGAALTGGETDMVARMARLEQALTTMPALKMITTESSNNDLARRGGFQSLSRSMSDAERINRQIMEYNSRMVELLRSIYGEMQTQGLI